MNVPLTVPVREPLEVRGEGVISWANFEKINLSLEEPYSHPRNLAAGSVRKLDATESGKRFLEFFAFDLVTDLKIPTKCLQMDFMKSNGFSVVPHAELSGMDASYIKATVELMDPKHYSQMFDLVGLPDSELTELDVCGTENEGRWHDMEPTPFIAIIKAETENESLSSLCWKRHRKMQGLLPLG